MIGGILLLLMMLLLSGGVWIAMTLAICGWVGRDVHGQRIVAEIDLSLGANLLADPVRVVREGLPVACPDKLLQQVIGLHLLLHARKGGELHGEIRPFHRVERVLRFDLRGQHLQKSLEITACETGFGLFASGAVTGGVRARCNCGRRAYHKRFPFCSQFQRRRFIRPPTLALRMVPASCSGSG